MIVVTGAAGFIGSCLVAKLNAEGFNDVVLVDDFSRGDKHKNFLQKKYSLKVERKNFADWLQANHKMVDFIFHLGARTDTTEFNVAVFDELNLNYSKTVWQLCVEFGLPLVYASSAATYGLGELGYNDDEEQVPLLKPLNPYGESKNDFDKWALLQERKPYFWVGLKFFNVYGPNEYHKGRMASVVYHCFQQVKNTGTMKLFRSHRPEYLDGGQLRDFVYVKDVVDVCYFFMHLRKKSGIYNLGSGTARSFNDLVQATFKAMQQTPAIEYIDTPIDIRATYQYYTEANMKKLFSVGFQGKFTRLEDGVFDYVKNYLSSSSYL